MESSRQFGALLDESEPLMSSGAGSYSVREREWNLSKRVTQRLPQIAELRPWGRLAMPVQLQREQAPTPTGRSSFRLEVLRDARDLECLLPHWDALLDRSAVRTPFLRADWLEIWSAVYAGEYDAWMGAAWHEDGTLVAVVPFVISRGNQGLRQHLRHLSFLGGLGEVVSEGQDLLALPGMEPVLDLLLDAVLTEASGAWDLASFPYLDMDSPHWPRLKAALHRQGAAVSLVNEQTSPCIRLDSPDWEGCLPQSSTRFRRKLRKRRHAAESSHEITFRSLETAEEAVSAMDTLLSLHGERWTAENSLFLHPRARRFHTELVRRWCPRKRVWMHLLEFDGRPVAMDYLFVDEGKVWDYQGGWSQSQAHYSPSALLRVLGIERAIQSGMREYDLLPGGSYKNDWTKVGRKVADLDAVNLRSSKALAFRALRTVKRSLTDLVQNWKMNNLL